jgi:hypothetical protein
MFDTILKPFSGLFDWAGRRATRGLVCDVRESRRIGGESDPGLYVTLVAENPQGENAFADAFEVEMLQPFHASAVRYEYQLTPNTPIAHLALNIPGHGVSEPVIAIAFFDQHLPYASACQARIAAVGRRGFRRRWREFSCATLEP